MILSCNSCEKKFVVPDNAIGATGRLVQCSSCGNKWKQFPFKTEIKTKNKIVSNIKKTKNITKIKKKKKGPDLYSPEYLSKKHGININENIKSSKKLPTEKIRVSFGFYNYLIITIFFTIFFLRILYFTQSFIIEFLPETDIYINYLFETINNIRLIIQNFFLGY